MRLSFSEEILASSASKFGPYKIPAAIVLSGILLPLFWNAVNWPIDDDIAIPSLFAIIAGWSIWAGLATRPFIERLAILSLAHLSFFVIVWVQSGGQVLDNPREMAETFVFFGGSASAFIFTTLTLVGAVAVAHGGPARSQSVRVPSRLAFQFSLRKAFLTTGMVALLLAIRRYADREGSFIDWAFMSDLQCDAAVLAIATTWLLLGSRVFVVRLALFATVIVASTVWLGMGGYVRNVAIWPAVFVIALSTILLPARLLGYRVGWRKNRATSVPCSGTSVAD